MNLKNDFNLNKLECPRYANAACFQASDKSDSTTEASGDEASGDEQDGWFRRGCSPFVFDSNSPICNDFGECTQTCTAKYCNISPAIVEPPMCHVCRQDFDHAGNVLSGDDDCFIIVDDQHLTQCDVFHNACETDTGKFYF